MTRQEFEDRLHSLVGRRIARVRYYEVLIPDDHGNATDEVSWNQDGRFDKLDYGLDLEVGPDDVYRIMWGNEFHCYGVSIERSATSDTSMMMMSDVSETGHWQGLIGMRISSVRAYWRPIPHGLLTSSQYPQAIELVFEPGAIVYISASEVRPDDSTLGMMDQIIVIFDAELVKRFDFEE